MKTRVTLVPYVSNLSTMADLILLSSYRSVITNFIRHVSKIGLVAEGIVHYVIRSMKVFEDNVSSTLEVYSDLLCLDVQYV